MRSIERDGVTLAYRDEGKGSSVVLIHGHTLDGRVFDPLVAPLVAAGHRVVRPDLRGHGRSSRPPRGYHWSHHAQDVAAVMNDAGLESATIVGFSLGGGVALEMALTMPNLVGSLVLIAPVMPDRPFEPAFLDNLKAVAKVARTEGIRAAMEGPWMQSPLFAASLEKAGVVEVVAEIVRDFPGADYLAEERDRVDRDWKIPDRLGEISAPTLVLVGEREMPGFKAFAAEAAEGIPGAGMNEISASGHLLPLEAHDQVVATILRHLA